MRPKRSDGKPCDTGTKAPERSHAAVDAILGRTAAGETLDKSSQIPAKWARHYRQLVNLQARLQAERRNLASAARQPLETFSLDLADMASDEFDHDLALCQLSHEQDALYEIDQALKRIENGTYGVCELTGKPIPEARLNALPWTRFVAKVERQLEQERAVEAVHLGDLRSVTEPIPDLR